MKALFTLMTLSLISLAFIPGEYSTTDFSKVRFDKSRNTAEQDNPIFRWPLPAVQGEARVNVEFVVLNDVSTGEFQNGALEEARGFLDKVYNPHGIYFNYSYAQHDLPVDNEELQDNWKNLLQESPGKMTLFIVNNIDDEQERVQFYTSNDIVSLKAIIPFSTKTEFNVYTAKTLGHMLGLLPTYFENSSLNVAAEDATNCGSAGDFVCDTPFDYLGLKNDVKQKNCKYAGELGKPDVRNIMSNSWSQCMDHITTGQANKIKYNLTEISVIKRALAADSQLKY